MNGNQFVRSELYGGYSSSYQLQNYQSLVGNGLPSSATAAAAFFKLQYRHDTWNPNGPSGSSNCGPASLAMLMAALGRAPQGISVETSIDHARYLMNPIGTAYREGVQILDQDNLYTSFTQIETGIRHAGGRAVTINSWDSLNQNLTSGNPAIVLGHYGNDWRAQFPSLTLTGNGNADHFIAILGRTADGRYIVGDPMYRGGPVEMTKDQLAVFFRSTQNSNFGVPNGRAFD